jgi:ribosomal protein S18 acetylase RimI-like enzyme
MSDAAPIRRPGSVRPRGGRPEEEWQPPGVAELQLIERQLALLPRFSGASSEQRPDLDALLVSLPGRGPGYNFAACLRWPEEHAEARLEALGRLFVERGEWPALVLAEGLSEPPGIVGLLATRGWVELERERIHVVRERPTVPHLGPSLRLEAATGRSAHEVQQVEQQVFGLAERFTAARIEHLARNLEAGTLRAYLLRLDGVVVASARLSAQDGLAAISGVGVLPEQRNQGFASLITAVATRAGLAMGNRLVWLSVDERNEPALKVYRRLGYRPSFGWARWAASAR